MTSIRHYKLYDILNSFQGFVDHTINRALEKAIIPIQYLPLQSTVSTDKKKNLIAGHCELISKIACHSDLEFVISVFFFSPPIFVKIDNAAFQTIFP
jgi:hypothetical protein